MEPLAYRMKPTKLEDFYGQEDIVGKDKLLYRLIKADKLTSAIFWGPPGCGKTSLARVIASTTKNKFVTLNATTSGVSDIKSVVEEAQNIFTNPTGKVILFTKINLENNLNDVVSMYDDGKSIKNINSFLKKNDSTAKLKVTNENNENVIFTITSNVNISTPGLNKILDSPYKVKVRRVIYNGS